MTTIATISHDEDSHDYGFVDGTELVIDTTSGEATLLLEDGNLIALNWEGILDELEQDRRRVEEEQKYPRSPSDILREQFRLDRDVIPYVVIVLGHEAQL